MRDLIDRQTAIDAADRADYTGLAVEDVKKVTDEVVKEIKKLPPAQPEVRTQMSSADCISRQEAIDAVMDEFKRIPTNAIRAKTRIEALPPAQPQIIRCKYCKYACIDPERESDEIYCSENDFWKDDDFYCGYAERRTEE